jgi:hypothetical protein
MSAKGFDALMLCLIVSLFSDLLLVWGFVLLARARGYSWAIVIAAWMCGQLMGCFVVPMTILAFILPMAVLFTLPDKHRFRPKRRPPD